MRLYVVDSHPEHLLWMGERRTGPCLYMVNSYWKRLIYMSERVDQEIRMRFLLSYWYYKGIDLDAWLAENFEGPYPDIFVDSGGFSADSQGVEITLEEYVGWIEQYGHLFSAYANLDVIGDQQGTNENQALLEEMGIAPVPILTLQRDGADYGTLERLLADGYEYIALGGLVPFSGQTKRLMPHLIKCFQMAGNRAVFHGFGLSTWEILRSLPFYSVDSTSWSAGVQYGDVRIFDERRCKLVSFQWSDKESVRTRAGLIESYGFDPVLFSQGRSKEVRRAVLQICGLSVLRAEHFLRKLHGEIVLPSQRNTADPEPHYHSPEMVPGGTNPKIAKCEELRKAGKLQQVVEGNDASIRGN